MHHQTSPFPTRIWLPPFAEPIATQAPYLISREINMIGMAMAQGLEERGQVGATHMGTGFDAWYPGYIDYMPMFQNISAFWTETALYRYATPHFYTLNDFPAEHARPAAAGALHEPVARRLVAAARCGGVHGDGVAVGARLRVAVPRARAAQSLSGRPLRRSRSTRRRRPYAYVVPQQQRDPVAAVELLRRLAFKGVRVSQLTAAATVEGATLPGGHLGHADGPGVRRDRRGSCSTCSAIRTCASRPDGPLEQPYDAAGLDAAVSDGRRR